MAELKVGDKAPSFKLENQHGEVKTEKDYAGAPYIIYFYPRASTPGCTDQGCSLRDAHEDLAQLDAQVIGVSPDSVKSQKKFDDKHNFGFSLLADENHELSEDYGVWGEKSMYGKKFMGITRSAFVVDSKGKIAGAFYKISPSDTVPKTLEVLNSL